MTVVEAVAWLVDNRLDDDVNAVMNMTVANGGYASIHDMARDHPNKVIQLAQMLQELIDQIPAIELRWAESKLPKERLEQ